MPLVSYDSSSDSDNEPEPSTSKETTIEPKATTSTGNLIARKNANNKKVEIFLPDFENLESSSSEDEEDQLRRKRIKPSNSKSHLFALLPPAKSSSIKVNASSSSTQNTIKPTTPAFVPYTLTQKKKPVAKLPKANVEDDGSDDETEGFFTFKDEVYPEVHVNVQDDKPEKDINVNIAPGLHKDSTVNIPVASSSSTSKSKDLSEEQFKKLVARKFGDAISDDVELVDVKVDDHLIQNREYLKTISIEKEEKVDGQAPNTTHKRKNHITHLAFQAKQRELSLKNQWAQNKLTQNQSRAKYGF